MQSITYSNIFMVVHAIAVLEMELRVYQKWWSYCFHVMAKKSNRLVGGDIRHGYLTQSLCTLKSFTPPQKNCSGYMMFLLPSSLLLWILSMYIYTNLKLQWIKTIKQIWDLQFSQHCFWQVWSSVMGAVLLGAWFFCDFMTLDDEGTTFLWNIAKHSPNDRASDQR